MRPWRIIELDHRQEFDYVAFEMMRDQVSVWISETDDCENHFLCDPDGGIYRQVIQEDRDSLGI